MIVKTALNEMGAQFTKRKVVKYIMGKAKKQPMVKTPEGRLSFASLFEKSGFDDKKKNYNAHIIFPKGTDLKALETAAYNAAVDKWGADKIPQPLISPFRDGNTEKPGQDAYKDAKFIVVKSNNKPEVVGRRETGDIGPVGPEICYSGCWVKFAVTTLAYPVGNEPYKPGVSFWLNSVYKVRDDEPFGNMSNAASDFAEEIAEVGSEDPANYEGGGPETTNEDPSKIFG